MARTSLTTTFTAASKVVSAKDYHKGFNWDLGEALISANILKANSTARRSIIF